LDYIGKYAFANCSYLEDVIIESKKIGDYAFYNSAYTYGNIFTIKSEVIGKYAFAYDNTGKGANI
jgi:hypothetical protein